MSASLLIVAVASASDFVAVGVDAAASGPAFEQPVRSVTIADALDVTYAGAANNIAELMAHGVAEEVAGSHPKLIRFPGVSQVLRVE